MFPLEGRLASSYIPRAKLDNLETEEDPEESLPSQAIETEPGLAATDEETSDGGGIARVTRSHYQEAEGCDGQSRSAGS